MKKKLLILGGANVHCKLVTAAKEMGVETIVVDYLEAAESPAKLIADKHYQIDIKDVDSIVKLCKEEKIDGVLSLFLDPAQRPYFEICNRLNLPCYIENWEQVFTLTDKDAFKNACTKYGVDTIPTYNYADSIQFPVLVKPAHSRGSRGQSVCNNISELDRAILIAKNESDNNEAIIEKYMGNKNDFTMTYFFIDGRPFLVRTADRLLGDPSNGLEKVAMAELTPSKYNDLYLKKIDKKISKMLVGLGIKNGPVFMQGFIDNDILRVYDPGFRFPGTEFDLIFIKNLNINLIKKMVFFALNGYITPLYGDVSDSMTFFNDKVGLELWPCVRPGTINNIFGFEKLFGIDEVVCYTLRHKISEEILDYRNVNQRLAEIDILCENLNHLKNTVLKIQSLISCLDDDGNEMIYNELNINSF